VTGVDISAEFIAEAQTLAKNTSKKPGPQFVLGDMRRLEGDLVYNGAYCFGNSFGFLQYTDMEKFLSGVAHALKPGARFIINTGMAAESILPDFEEQSSHQVGDISMTVKERYVAAESCIDSEYIFERDGRRESHFAKHWIYTTAEIQRMLERAGFEVVNLYGSLKCEPYKLGTQELFVVAESPKSRVQSPTSGD
jgi:SAM-dependent methyltransferase